MFDSLRFRLSGTLNGYIVEGVASAFSSREALAAAHAYPHPTHIEWGWQPSCRRRRVWFLPDLQVELLRTLDAGTPLLCLIDLLFLNFPPGRKTPGSENPETKPAHQARREGDRERARERGRTHKAAEKGTHLSEADPHPPPALSGVVERCACAVLPSTKEIDPLSKKSLKRSLPLPCRLRPPLPADIGVSTTVYISVASCAC